MKLRTVKLKKGGLDTIVAYIVVMLPLLYVLIYMVATIYHFSVQMYMDQVVKEAAIMASTYGALTPEHAEYIYGKLEDVIGVDESGKTDCTIKYYIREFSESSGVVDPIQGPFLTPPSVDKADIIGIYVESDKPSLLGTVSAFSIFGGATDEAKLKYTSYREEIIRNEKPQSANPQ